MKTYSCKVEDCGYSVEANAPGVLGRHRKEAHPELKRIYRRRKSNRTAPATQVQPNGAGDAELALLNTCAAAFDAAETDREADRRVLEYLASRWGPAAYEGIEEDAPAEPAAVAD